jgi:dTDP-4-amino-4,6-dideoxygalactose transaminase
LEVNFTTIAQFEQALCDYTGAPFAIATDCCTHALELCLRYERPEYVQFTAFTYLSVPMVMHKLSIGYSYLDHEWLGEYPIHGTRIWDSARLLAPGMYRAGQMQCVSFGRGKPLEIGRGGAILLDDPDAYQRLRLQRYDGRDLSIVPWQDQQTFYVGYHYKMNPEEAAMGLEKLPRVDPVPKYHQYPDLRSCKITENPIS